MADYIYTVGVRKLYKAAFWKALVAYFNVFVRSVNGIQPISVEEWKKEWEKINSIISGMNLNLSSYTQDSIEIAGLLQQDKYVMHHSRAFNEAYDLHYRIMDKNFFKKELLPLMK